MKPKVMSCEFDFLSVYSCKYVEMLVPVCVFLIFSVRVSNELGLGRPRAAKYSVYVTIFQSLLLGIFFMAVILATRDYYGVIFTNSLVLQKAVSKLGFLLAITMVLNSVQPVISGIIDYHFHCLLHCSTLRTILKSFLQVLLLVVGGKPLWPTST